MIEYITIHLTIMAIERDYYFLDRLEELKRENRIGEAEYLRQKNDILESLEDLCQDNPFNQLKEELNLN